MSALFSSILALGIVVSLWMSAMSARAADPNDMSTRLFTMQKALAEQKGDVQAQYYLAQMYEHGLGTPEDMEQARLWYERAAAKGHPMARRQLQELARAKQEADAELQRAAQPARAVIAAPRAAPDEQAAPQTPARELAPRVAVDTDKAQREAEAAAEAARRSKEKARAERKRAAQEYLRRQLANPVGEPFE